MKIKNLIVTTGVTICILIISFIILDQMKLSTSIKLIPVTLFILTLLSVVVVRFIFKKSTPNYVIVKNAVGEFWVKIYLNILFFNIYSYDSDPTGGWELSYKTEDEAKQRINVLKSY